MTKNVFSVPIFIICLRESVEASIILSVLLALVEQIVYHAPSAQNSLHKAHTNDGEHVVDSAAVTHPNDEAGQKRLVKRLRVQIFAGTFLGLFCAVAIGAAFLVVYYTSLKDLYGSSEELWEGIFCLIASIMIFVMGLTMMRMDRAKIRWKLKLARAFENDLASSGTPTRFRWFKMIFGRSGRDKSLNSSKYLLFFLPFVTVLREGLEAVVFVGGVSMGQPASSIPLAAIIGIICGLSFGFFIYRSSSRLNLSIFLVVSTAFLFLIGAGLFTRAAFYFLLNDFISKVGGDVAEAGDGPGSFPVDGYIWHLDYGNPELKSSQSGGWQIFSAIFGWFNTGYYLTVLLYIAYWLAVVIALIYMKWSEGRTSLFGYKSQAYHDRMTRQEHKQIMAQADAQAAARQRPAAERGTGGEGSLHSTTEMK